MSILLMRTEMEHSERAELLSYVNEKHEPNDMGSSVVDETWDHPLVEELKLHAMAVLGGFEETGRLMCYMVVTPHDPERDKSAWAHGYPHSHGYVYRTLVHYLHVGAGAPLVLWDERGPLALRSIKPVTGMTVVFDGKQEHGFHNWEGPPRVAFVVQQVPENYVATVH